MANANYQVEVDLTGGGTFTDVTRFVESCEVSWGTDVEGAVSDIRFVTARGSIRLLDDPSIRIESPTQVRITDTTTGNEAWRGRAIPSVHEPFLKPNFLLWQLEGMNAPAQRQSKEFFLAPRSDIGTLDNNDVGAPVSIRRMQGSTSYITGEMTPAQFLNRLANLAGGYCYETQSGIVSFVNLREAFAQDATTLLPSELGALAGETAMFLNRQSVRSETVVRATNYVRDPNNPVGVGLEEFVYPVSTRNLPSYLSFKPAPDRTLRIDEWVVPIAPDDVPVLLRGGGGQFARIRSPRTGVAGVAELFYGLVIPPAGNRLVRDFGVLFNANVSRLSTYELRTAKFTEAVETFGSVDANLPPWATHSMYQRVIEPWLQIRSRPLWHFSVCYEESQAGSNSLELIQSVQPGLLANVSLPSNDGEVTRKSLILGVRLVFGRGRIPRRYISGVSSAVRAVVSTFSFEADAFGPFDGRATLTIGTPGTGNAYARYREQGTNAWTELGARSQQTQINWPIPNLDPETVYEAQGGLQSNYSDAITDVFTTDASESASHVGGFCPADEDGDEFGTNEISMMLYYEAERVFIIGARNRIYFYNSEGAYYSHQDIRLRRSSDSGDATGTVLFAKVVTNNRPDNGRLLVSIGDNRTDARVATYNIDLTAGTITLPADATVGFWLTNIFQVIRPTFRNQDIVYFYTRTSEADVNAQRSTLITQRVLDARDYAEPTAADEINRWARVATQLSWDDTNDELDVWDTSDFATGSVRFPNTGRDGNAPPAVPAADAAISPYRSITNFGGAGYAAEGQVFYILDRSTACIYAMDRSGAQHERTTTTALLQGLLINGFPVRGFSPRNNTYTFLVQRSTVGIRPIADEVYIEGIKFNADDLVTYTPRGGVVPFAGGHVFTSRGERQAFTATVTNPDGSGATTYTVTVQYGFSFDEDRTPRDTDDTPELEAVAPFIELSPTSITVGEQSTLTWGAAEGSTVVIDRVNRATNLATARVLTAAIGGGSVNGSRSVQGTGRAGTFYYRIRATLGGNTQYAVATLVIGAAPSSAPPVITTFRNNRNNNDPVPPGTAVAFDWAVTADRVLFGPVGSLATVNATGRQTVRPSVTTTYALEVTRNNITVTRQSTITVRQTTTVPTTVTPGTTPVTRQPTPTEAANPSSSLTVNGSTTTRNIQPGTTAVIAYTFSGVSYARLIFNNLVEGTETVLTLTQSGSVQRAINQSTSVRLVVYDSDGDVISRLTRTRNIVTVSAAAPSASITVTGASSGEILETQSVNIRYTTRNATSASITTSRGVQQIPAPGLPLSGGVLLDRPTASGTVTYAITAVNSDGVSTRRTSQVRVRSLPRITEARRTSEYVENYDGSTSVAVRATGADSYDILNSIGTIVASGVFGAAVGVIAYNLFNDKWGGGPGSFSAAARRTFRIVPKLAGFDVPALSSISQSVTFQWPLGIVTRPTEAFAGELFVNPQTPNSPGLFTDIAYVTNNRPNAARGNRVAYRSRPNLRRNAFLSTREIATIVPDAQLRSVTRGTFATGGLFSSTIRGSGTSTATGIITSCATACDISDDIRLASRIAPYTRPGSGISSRALQASIVQSRIAQLERSVSPVLRSLLGGNYDLTNLARFSQIMGRAASILRAASAIAGPAGAILSALDTSFRLYNEFITRVEFPAAAMASTVALISNGLRIIDDEGLATKDSSGYFTIPVPGLGGGRVKWNTDTMRLVYPSDYDLSYENARGRVPGRYPRYSGEITGLQWPNPRNPGGNQFVDLEIQMYLTAVADTFLTEDGNDYLIDKPVFGFLGGAGSRIDNILGAGVAYIDSLLSGPSLAALGEAEILARG